MKQALIMWNAARVGIGEEESALSLELHMRRKISQKAQLLWAASAGPHHVIF